MSASISCQHARELFSGALDDALGPGERQALDLHLAGCAGCRRELERLERTVSLLRGIEPIRAPAGFVDRVLAAARPEPWWRRFARRLVPPWAVKLPVKVAGAALVATMAVYLAVGPRLSGRVGFYQDKHPESSDAARSPTSPSSEAARLPTSPSADAARSPITPAPLPAAPSAATSHAERVPLTAEGARTEAEQYKQREQLLSARQQAKALAERRAPPPSPPGPPQESQEVSGEAEKPLSPSSDAQRLRSTAEGPPPIAQPPAASRDAAVATRALHPIEVDGRLRVVAIASGRVQVADLVARLGGTVVPDRTELGDAVIDVLLPRARYDELAAELGKLGQWSAAFPPVPAARAPTESQYPGDEIRILVRLVE